MVSDMMRTFSVTQTGASHTAVNRPCQDYSLSVFCPDYAIAIVADGHGGDAYFRSDRGSRFAAESARDVLAQFLSATKNMTALPEGGWQRQLASAIISEWQQRISKDYQQEPFDTSTRWQKAYGTTLIAAVRTERLFMGMQIGDGRCVAIDAQGAATQPIPWDNRCFLNRTTSLCDADALNEFRFCLKKRKLPCSIFVGTDGVEDCFAGIQGLYEFYQLLYSNLVSDFDASVNELEHYLPSLSEQGSKDDISIAGILL